MARAFGRYLVGLFLGTITPGRLGETARALYVKRDTGKSLGMVFSGVIADRLYDLYVLLIFGLLGAWKFGLAGGASFLFAVVALTAALLPVCFLCTTMGRSRLVGVVRRMADTKLGRFGGGEMGRFVEGFEPLMGPGVLSCTAMTVAAYGVFFVAGYLLIRALDLPVSFHDAALALAAANTLSLLPITFAGVGTRDALLVLTLGKESIAPEAALALSLLILLCSYLVAAAVGFVLFIGDKPPRD
jgi:uncharacterized protein (TIRG00374 family)